jgi:large subunit ribosomal protein L4
MGNIKSPLLRGGGSVFGPDPRDYSYKVPKKVRKLALKMALTSKLKDDELLVVDKFEFEQIKTKKFLEAAENLKITNALIVIDDKNENLELSARNISNIKVLHIKGLNVVDILKYKNLVLVESSIKAIEGRLLP